ncbi:methylated-DNA--[protein]-cysteine S-methyltransferase [Heliobacterium chlorum]|uniref:Methylated-DNA--protein-cysteine methyltransferase n=2 Tax=Heliobacterium chlorum TaxID=2698 RepID=A0ABR7T7V8_HELCL|nr:methylated-DNA--[protein]-cysteine S-methyltransferase [Heliobacterium chlorum]
MFVEEGDNSGETGPLTNDERPLPSKKDFFPGCERGAAQEASVPECLTACLQQLDEYFRGTRKDFNVKLNPQGTQFQKQVWRKLPDIPYGKTASYKDIAEAVGNPKAVRAVGGANSQNPISIIVPCHRIIGSNGKLTGYAGGLWRKEWLLAHEQKVHTSPEETPR